MRGVPEWDGKMEEVLMENKRRVGGGWRVRDGKGEDKRMLVGTGQVRRCIVSWRGCVNQTT